MTQDAATRARAWPQWLWLGSALSVIMLGLFVGPRVPDERQAEFCVVNVHLAGPFGISLNCDSPDFMRLAREPAGLLEPRDARQSRPGLIVAAAALALPLTPLADLAERAGARAARADIDPSRVANSLANDFPGYVAYIGLNVAFLLMSFALFRRICAPLVADSTAIAVSVGVLLVANDVVKAFVWSPHNQMFNILVPVFALYGCIRAAEGTLASRRFALLTGFATGLGVTAYPLFVIIAPCVLAGWLVDIVRHRRMPRGSAMGSTINLALLAALTVLPEGLWYLFVRLKTGDFYQHEMALGQVTWMLDSAQGGLGALRPSRLPHCSLCWRWRGWQIPERLSWPCGVRHRSSPSVSSSRSWSSRFTPASASSFRVWRSPASRPCSSPPERSRSMSRPAWKARAGKR
jgi:hypothetical protein